MTEPAEDRALPTAEVVRRPRWSFAWLLPLLTAVLVALLVHRAWSERGATIIVELSVGHGLQEGDPVRYRGIDVGRVQTMQLAPGLDRVRSEIVLDAHAVGLARVGTRFWVVRPRLGPSGVSGLETLIGSRHLGVDPAPPSAPPTDRFVALDEPPIEPAWGDGLRVVLEASTRGGIAAGAPVLYRQFPVGLVTAVGLSSDAAQVEFELSIDPTYADLVRTNTRFWEVAGVELEFDLLSGLSLELDSLESVLSGGVALASPNDPGDRVTTGRRYPLGSEAPEDWTRWRPDVPLGSALLPPGTPIPRPAQVTLRWRERGLFGKQRSRSGWALRVPTGFLGPDDLLCVPDDARDGSARVELEGRTIPARTEPTNGGRLVVIEDDGPGAAWPTELRRAIESPEDLLVFAPANGIPRAVDAARQELEPDGRLLILGDVGGLRAHHGAPALARVDGALIGVLCVDDDRIRIAPLPLED